MESKKAEVYTGKYKGVPYEIRKWNLDREVMWNFYLFFVEEQIPEHFESIWLKGERVVILGRKTRFVFYKYTDTWIVNLDWHCGCTFYEKISGFDDATRVVKAGCDYSHLYDEHRHYDLPQIEHDVKECIESLLRIVKVFHWCKYCGEYSETVNEKEWCPKCVAEHTPA